MQFGVIIHSTAPYADWDLFLEIAKEAERLGYDSIWITDHLISPKGRSHGLESWTILSALAAVTKKIHLGTYVLCNQFRHPSLLAKMVSTIDHVSKGRIILGIGAGWYKTEHIAFGFNWDNLSVRINRLKESILLMKKLWTEDIVTFNGEYYKVKNATLEPKPIQKPHPPIWIGGVSPAIKRLLTEEGNGWIPVLPSPEQLSKDIEEIKKKMKINNRKFNQLEIAFGGAGYTLLTDNKKLANKELKKISNYRDIPIDNLNCLIGDSSFIKEKIQQYEKVGVKHIVTGFLDFPSLTSLRQFSESVIPTFK
ncbi:MAG: LLM class flavin-dependent oxidoreductase [Promethearchaeota archaeon]|nr:MAG: LLM class flavin-dependent oxidoreductase [Candidatus Lokiarchaeota archaeon]